MTKPRLKNYLCPRLAVIMICCTTSSCIVLRPPMAAPALQKIGKLPIPQSAANPDLAKTRMAELQSHADTYDSLISQANALFSQFDGHKRGTSKAAILSQMGIAAGGIATAALNAASPAANAAWIQGLNAGSTGVASVRSEFSTQRMTSEAYSKMLTFLANEVITARAKVNFPEALSLVGDGDQKSWTGAMRSLGDGIRALEDAIVLSPLTVTLNVVRDSATSPAISKKR